MFQNFIFDMGNVLMDFSPDYILSNFTSNVGDIQLMKKVIFRGQNWAKLDQGLLSFGEVCRLSKEKLPIRLHKTCDRFFDEWHLHKTPITEMVSLVSDLHDKGYGIYLCSNAASRFHTYKDNCEVFKYFNDLTISADLKISKPNPTIYQYILDKQKLDPITCLFIDDLEVNINGAKKLGIEGYLFNGNTALFRKYLENIKAL